MNFNSIVRSAYSWLSVKKIIWFIAFFWISLPFILILPKLFESGAIYSELTKPLAIILYDVLYIALIVGVILLIQRCLLAKHERAPSLGITKVIKLVLLVFVELFYAFVWNINARFRRIQILLLISSALLGYLFALTLDNILLVIFAWGLLAYFYFVIRNCIMLFFSTTIFVNMGSISITGAVKESYSLIHNRVADTFSSIIISAFLAFVLFAFVTLAMGALASLVLRFFFIDSLAVSLGFNVSTAFGIGIGLIAYHFMIAEVFAQLNKHKAASTSIKRILAHRVLHPKAHKPVAVRSSLHKKKAKKKSKR